MPLALVSLLLPLLLPLASAPPAASGRVDRNIQTVRYPVEGATVQDVGMSMARTVRAVTGQPYYGLTEWEVQARYRLVESSTGCRVEGVVVQLDVTLTLPQWRPPAGAPLALRRDWQAFARSLERHERRHLALVEQAAEAARWELVTLRRRDCTAANAAADERLGAILADYTARNHEYDQRTDHGRTEGAVWPVR